ncbi:MAG: tripartite tricarboxylate transporter permease [Promethearchaeota archaeon]
MIELNIILMCIVIAALGVTVAVFLSLIPGLHIYAILGFVVLALLNMPTVEPILFATLVVSMLIGYNLGSIISSVYFQTPDDSSVFMIFPSQRYLQERRGFEAVYLSGLGAIIGVIISALLIIFAGNFLAKIVDLLVEHSLWIIATAMAFVWMSEWPKDPANRGSRIKDLASAWVQLIMGAVTIIASGILGIYLFFGQLVPAERAFQGLAAAFVGLFAFPSLLQNLISAKTDIPKQNLGKTIEGGVPDIFQGTVAGVIGGSIGMLIPSLTAGVGNSFSRHAVAQSGDRSFLLSQGVSRSVYYVGAVLLLFIPGVTIRRGGAALFISLFYIPYSQSDLFIVAATALISAAIGWFLFKTVANMINKRIHKINTRYISLFSMIFILTLLYLMLGVSGFIIMAIATAIGYIPIAFNTRRIHCIGVITIPIMLSMAGLSATVAALFGIA